MSYMRAAWPLRFVVGESNDYVFCASHGKGKGEYIEDYGSISDTGFIEMLMKWWKTDDELFKHHFIKRLAERLKVRMRKTPLTIDEVFDRMEKICERREAKK